MTKPLKSSPHLKSQLTTDQVMRLVIFACIPAALLMYQFFGVGVLINLALAIISAVTAETAIVALRGRSILAALRDNSAILTAVLLGLALPAYCSWWIPVVGSVIAIVIAKQLFGGLGANPFNPAMVGYVVLLISFPVEMSQWIGAREFTDGSPGLDAILSNASIDAWTMATPLDAVRNLQGITYNELVASDPQLSAGIIGSKPFEAINFAFLLGGLYLLKRRIFTWHAPVAMLVSLFVISLLFWSGSGSDTNGSPMFHLFSGATMMGAFFIITDPVSGCTSRRGRLIFGALVGVLVYVIRAWGNYPDAVAFAVLLANLSAPFIDYYTTPRSYGHTSSKIIISSKEDA
ncbi:MAG: RnfABCDGE type electron transport complex subunit D [Gammaproteobacteria bacterium]|nr:RnfABCDGE type electron transport complex subunit D [Gammaproteobacteria bacterium]